ncbi:MAG: bifunctional folylpolyglutamate synthase/dihydrofolate synthase [Nitrospinae bacterium]|nr:bifunctional folylpolyglutamate synthase/dihydrofolate synthase [Nitrospinota bacterium]
MDVRDPVEWLLSLTFRGIRMGLANMEALLARLGNPQAKVPSIIVGGTNGKGTTSALIASILSASGRRTGLYISPHVADIRERIAVDGAPVAPDDFARLAATIRRVAAQESPIPVTFFETITAMGFLHFAEQKLDAAVVEVGLGGLLDAVNMAPAGVAVITSIGLDHADILGGTLKEVAFEKLGIVKQGRPLVSGVTRPRLQAHFERSCAEKGATLYRIGREFDVRYRKSGLTGERFDYRDDGLVLSNIKLPLVGRRQADNGALAIRAARLFAPDLSEKVIRAGVAGVKVIGRFETVRRDPLVIVDGAHNPPAVEELVKTVARHIDRPVDLVFGAMRDKDYRAMLATLAPLCRSITLYAPPMERAAPLADLHAAVPKDFAGPVTEAASPEEVARFIDASPADAVWLVAGSFYVVGAIRRQLVP